MAYIREFTSFGSNIVRLKKYVNKKNFYSIGVITSLVVIVLSFYQLLLLILHFQPLNPRFLQFLRQKL